MSSPEAFGASCSAPCQPAHRTVRRFMAAVVLGISSLSLSACAESGGFKPLYGATGGETYDQRLAKVDIAPVPGRVGQRIRNELVFERSTGAQAISPELRLDIIITETLLTTLVNATGASSSQVYQLEARYQLIDLKTKKSVLDGRSLGRGSFDRFAAIYSNIRAREDAENRVAKSIADDIRTRLLAHLSRQG
jgi:LPS-assembly lipoprotein